jgi:hypothetical protein
MTCEEAKKAPKCKCTRCKAKKCHICGSSKVEYDNCVFKNGKKGNVCIRCWMKN